MPLKKLNSLQKYDNYLYPNTKGLIFSIKNTKLCTRAECKFIY